MGLRPCLYSRFNVTRFEDPMRAHRGIPMNLPSDSGQSIKRRTRRQGTTLLEVIVVLLVVGLLAVVLFARVSRQKRGMRGLVCQSNLKGIGTSCLIYANDFGGVWPTPGFDETKIGEIDYTIEPGGGQGTAASPDRTQLSYSGPGGAQQLSGTRAMWMLVRTGYIVPKQFVCPQSGESPDETEDIEAYYDFAGDSNISYGYQVPFGPRETRAGEGMDSRVALAADQGPYFDATIMTPPKAWFAATNQSGSPVGIARGDWQPFNSPNHGGSGQNVLFRDGHTMFHRTPVVGVDQDNIYTVALDNANLISRMAGESPWVRKAHPYAPVDAAGTPLASTDSLIFP